MTVHRAYVLHDVMASPCAVSSCDHDYDDCPRWTVEVCEQCTFGEDDTEPPEIVIPVPWPCREFRKQALSVVSG